jgi:hypothetical protein
VALVLAAPAGVAAQLPAEVAGRVVRLAGPDTLLVPQALVVLHRIGQDTQGAIDSLPLDRIGRFRFRFTADTTAIYLLSVRHHGIAYFSSPVARSPGGVPDEVLLIVSDTSGTAPVGLGGRSVIIGAAGGSGSRTVVDVLEIANRGQQTRVAAGEVPTLAVPLPAGGHGFVLEDTDLSPESVQFRNDSLVVFAPLAPGERVVILQYTIPAGTRRLVFPPGVPVDTLQLLLEAGQVTPLGALPEVGAETIEGRRYGRWMGPWSGAEPLVLEVRGLVMRPDRLLVVLVAALVLAMGAGLVLLLRRHAPAPGAPAAAATPAELVEAIARLDAQWQQRGAAASAAERTRYETERTRLKALLERALAGKRRVP